MAIKLTLHNCLCLLFYAVVHCRSNITRLLLREPLFSVFYIFIFNDTLPLYLSSCLSAYTPSCTLCSSSDDKTLSCASWDLKGFGYRSFSVQKLPLSGTTFPVTSDTAVLSHGSKLLLKLLSLLLPTLSCSNPFIAIDCCT